MSGRFRSLSARIAALALGIMLVTAGAGAAITVTLVQRANERAAVQSLAAFADTAQALAALAGSPEVGQARAARALDASNIKVAIVRFDPPKDPVITGDALPRRVVAPEMLSRLARGEAVSTRFTIDGGRILVEARPTSGGAVILAQRGTDALGQVQQALTQGAWAWLGLGVLAVLVSLGVARRIVAPLRRTASAATELAAGRRDVLAPEQGPAEVVEVAASVNHLARSLAHSEARQREFLLSVSHDLRTPLTAISGYAESLADAVVPPERTAEVGRILSAEAARLERMVGDLLDLARLQSHEARFSFVDADAAAIVRSAEPTWQQRCCAAGIPLTIQAPAPVPVTADPDRLRQALDGLMDNAIRVTPSGRPIVVAARAEAGEAVLEVRDAGPGLTDADLPVAFERSVLHERYRHVREAGTGLGLAIVAGIAARHSGRAEAGHAPEGGARFTIRLPLRHEIRTPS